MTAPWGGRTVIEVSSAAPDADPPVWVDVSDYMSFRNGPLTAANGQQTDQDAAEPGIAALAWRNDDHRFTTGNPSSPYPWFKEARRVRVRDFVGDQVFPIFDGYLGPPTTVPSLDPADPTGTNTFLTTVAAASDRLSRLRTARKFTSTLTEYIRYTGGSALQLYYPLLDTQPSLFANIVGASAPLRPRDGNGGPAVPPATPTTGLHLSAATGPKVFADDLPTPTFLSDLATTTTPPIPGVWTSLYGLPTITCTNNTITLAFWWYPDASRSAGGPNGAPCALWNRASTNDIEVIVSAFGASYGVDFNLGSSNFNGSITRPRLNAWNLMALQMTLPSGACTVFNHNLPGLTGVMSGTPGATATFEVLQVGIGDGSVAHVQVYLGTGYTQAFHNAQILAAQTGLEQQTTGQRINTILDYAGVSSARDIDPGVDYMSVASLAGKDPLTCLEEARRTERGRLFVAGDGRVQFHDRTRVYNV